MAINLQKGQKIDLTKTNPSLDYIVVGLGWDPAIQKKSFFSKASKDIDCDSSVIMLNKDEKYKTKDNIIYFGNKQHNSNSITHMGDNITGEGDGDDEQIRVYLSKIPQEIEKLVFVVNIYDCIQRKQDFGLIKNAYIRIVDMKTNNELMKFNLTEDFTGYTALTLGEVYRNEGEWKFFSSGVPSKATGLSDIVKAYI